MWLLRLSRLLLLVALLVAGIVTAATHGLLCRLGLSRPAQVNRLARYWYRSLLAVMNVHVQLRSDTTERRGLIVANHVSWLDIPVLGSVLPTYFLSKAEVRNMPVVGWLSERGGTLFIHRGRHQLGEVRDLMRSRLTDGHFLTFFPEATTGPGDRLRPFHPRLFSAAIDTGTPVLPVAIHYQGGEPMHPEIPFRNESFLRNVWRVLGLWRTTVDVTVLPALDSQDKARRELADEARSAVAQALNLPPEPAPPGFPGKEQSSRA